MFLCSSLYEDLVLFGELSFDLFSGLELDLTLGEPSKVSFLLACGIVGFPSSGVERVISCGLISSFSSGKSGKLNFFCWICVLCVSV